MNRGFVNKIIEAVFKILNYIKIKKKSNTMPDNQQPTPVQPVQPQPITTLGRNTIIQFTIKGFFATMLSILSVFGGFYFMVFVPRAEKVEQYQKELMGNQQTEITKQFKAVNDGIGANNKSIINLTTRFEDLNDAVEDIANSGGGFGGTISSASHTTEPAVDPRLAENHQ